MGCGSLRVWHDLRAAGEQCGINRVVRLMKVANLQARRKRRRLSWRHRKQAGESHRAEPSAARVRDAGAQPKVGCKLHLHLDGRGLARCRSGDGPVLATHCGLVDERHHASPNGERCAADGLVAKK